MLRKAIKQVNTRKAISIKSNGITYKIFTKDILYIEKADSLVRRSVQTVLYNIIKNLDVLLAPILPYTMEEIYSYIPGDKLESVHLCDMPEVQDYEIDNNIVKSNYENKYIQAINKNIDILKKSLLKIYVPPYSL